MTDEPTSRPLPVPDAVSAPFWQAAACHELTMAQCGNCSTFSYPPDPVCLACGSFEPGWQFVPVSGKGRILSWTVVRQALIPGVADLLPYVTVDVELDEQPGLRMVARLLDGMDVPLALDDRVEACFEDLAPGVAVPAFRLADE
ncbi:MAG: OB-fold domain-containing protein [Novosphingobium sp.]|nr:OB-fold domain-containing protein [Novosphingobium sp.]